MFPAQSLMDNVALSIDSWLAAVIIPSYPFLSICFDTDWKAKGYADIYTRIMIIGAYSTLDTAVCSHYKSNNHARTLLFI